MSTRRRIYNRACFAFAFSGAVVNAAAAVLTAAHGDYFSAVRCVFFVVASPILYRVMTW